jgi:DUF2905 family protein
MGKLLIIIGAVITVLGVVIQYAPWLLSWFGHLPGDIRIENQHSFFFIPVTSMLVTSGILSILLYLLSFFR